MSEQNQLSQDTLFGDDAEAKGDKARENGASPNGGKASRRVNSFRDGSGRVILELFGGFGGSGDPPFPRFTDRGPIEERG